MNKINCPECGKAFKIDETGYSNILEQVRNDQFQQELEKQLELAEANKAKSIELAKRDFQIKMQESFSTKDTKIQTREGGGGSAATVSMQGHRKTKRHAT